MVRALSVAVLVSLLAGFIVAANPAVSDVERAQPAAASQFDADCGDGVGSRDCTAMCVACATFAANAAVQLPGFGFNAVPSTPARGFVEATRAPDAAPPRRFAA